MDERPPKQNGSHPVHAQSQQQNRVRFQEPDKDDDEELQEERQDDGESNQVRIT